MRHLKKKAAKFGRERGPRRALLSNLAMSVILYEKVRTTEAKAKAVRPMVERLVTRGKRKSLASKQALGKVLPEKKAVQKLLDVLGPRYKDRAGGYTRITKIGSRQGDGARMAIIEFV
ncbi:MAG: 50S ribosomal protein L17 [Patescibacteria group bacterium]